MVRRIITNPKFIVEHDGDNWVLKFKDGNIYIPIEFKNKYLGIKKNTIITNPNFSIVGNNLMVNISGKETIVGQVASGYELSNTKKNNIIEHDLSVMLNDSGEISITADVNGRNIVINNEQKEKIKIIYKAITKPSSKWIDDNCIENNFDEKEGVGELLLKDKSYEIINDGINNIFSSEGSDENVSYVKIGDGIFHISDCTFKECLYIEKLELPSTLIEIGQETFAGCEQLNDVNIYATKPPELGIDSFDGIDKDASLTVPTGSVSSYQESDWKEYFSNITDGQK